MNCPLCPGLVVERCRDESFAFDTGCGVVQCSVRRLKYRECLRCGEISYPAVSCYKRDAARLHAVLDLLKVVTAQRDFYMEQAGRKEK